MCDCCYWAEGTRPVSIGNSVNGSQDLDEGEMGAMGIQFSEISEKEEKYRGKIITSKLKYYFKLVNKKGKQKRKSSLPQDVEAVLLMECLRNPRVFFNTHFKRLEFFLLSNDIFLVVDVLKPKSNALGFYKSLRSNVLPLEKLFTSANVPFGPNPVWMHISSSCGAKSNFVTFNKCSVVIRMEIDPEKYKSLEFYYQYRIPIKGVDRKFFFQKFIETIVEYNAHKWYTTSDLHKGLHCLPFFKMRSYANCQNLLIDILKETGVLKSDAEEERRWIGFIKSHHMHLLQEKPKDGGGDKASILPDCDTLSEFCQMKRELDPEFAERNFPWLMARLEALSNNDSRAKTRKRSLNVKIKPKLARYSMNEISFDDMEKIFNNKPGREGKEDVDEEQSTHEDIDELSVDEDGALGEDTAHSCGKLTQEEVMSLEDEFHDINLDEQNTPGVVLPHPYVEF